MLARLPIAPRLGKLLLVTRRAKLVDFGLPLAAMLAQQDPYDHRRQRDRDEGASEGDGAEEDEEAEAAGVGSGVDAAAGAAPKRWKHAGSEALGLLGTYLQWQEAGGDEAAALRCCLVPKVMKEASQLAQQLGQLLATLYTDAAPPEPAPAPPSAAQATELCRALAHSLPDRVARLASLCDSPRERQLLLSAADDVKPALLRKAYLAAEQAGGQLLWLPPHAEIATQKPRPQYVAFYEVNHAKRPYMAVATAIDPAWLPEASPALTTLGAPRRDLAPRYERASDTPLCWVTPTYGSAEWTLPPVARPPPADDPEFRAALFARLLCEAHVLPALAPLASILDPRSRSLTDAALTDRAALALRAALCERDVFSLAPLAAIWESEPRFLVREMAALLPQSSRPQLLELWPKLLVQAERGGDAPAKVGKRRRA